MSKLMLSHMQTVSKLFKYWSTSSELESASSILKFRKFYQFQTFFTNGLQKYSMIFTFGAIFHPEKNFQKLMFKRTSCDRTFEKFLENFQKTFS